LLKGKTLNSLIFDFSVNKLPVVYIESTYTYLLKSSTFRKIVTVRHKVTISYTNTIAKLKMFK